MNSKKLEKPIEIFETERLLVEPENDIGANPPIFDNVILDYFNSCSVSHAALACFLEAVTNLIKEDSMAALTVLAGVLEPHLQQRLLANAEDLKFLFFESSEASVASLTIVANSNDRFADMRHTLCALVRSMQNDSLRRYMQPGCFVTADTLDRDLHSTLRDSKFEVYFSPTFQPRRHIVNSYIDRFGTKYRGDVCRGYHRLLDLAGMTQLDQFESTSAILHEALNQVRGQTVSQVLRSILEPSEDFQLLRLGQLIAFSLGQPALPAAEPESSPVRRGCMARLMPSNATEVEVQFVLRLPSCVVVVDEYPNGMPSVNLSRLICMFQRGRTEPVNLAESGVFVAPYCSNEDTRLQYFGSESLHLFENEQLAHPSVRAALFFIGRAMASSLRTPDSLESRMLRACFHGSKHCQVLLVTEEGVELPDEAPVSWDRATSFVLPKSDDEIEWRNLLVRLSNLPRAQHPALVEAAAAVCAV